MGLSECRVRGPEREEHAFSGVGRKGRNGQETRSGRAGLGQAKLGPTESGIGAKARGLARRGRCNDVGPQAGAGAAAGIVGGTSGRAIRSSGFAGKAVGRPDGPGREPAGGPKLGEGPVGPPRLAVAAELGAAPKKLAQNRGPMLRATPAEREFRRPSGDVFGQVRATTPLRPGLGPAEPAAGPAASRGRAEFLLAAGSAEG